jgi:hypothetical protein
VAGTLEPGSTYLLATRYASKYEWYQCGTHAAAAELISSDATLSSGELSELALSNQVLQTMLKAYPDEVVPLRDGGPTQARNSFAALPEEEKQDIFESISRLPPVVSQ